MDAQRFLEVVGGERRGISARLQRAALRVASWPYSLAMRLRNVAYDRAWLSIARADVPVISVGNLTVGGTGKTPCVEYVARHYRGRGRQVAILSRGYGATAGPNDEALVLEENLPDVPHYQGSDRVTLARAAVEESESDVLVLDDGFQHRRLARDLDLVLLDATNPWGHGYLLPRGLLREPARGLHRAGAIVLTRCDQVSGDALATIRREVRRLTTAPIVETRHDAVELLDAEGNVAPLDALKCGPVAAFCGLGNPAAFEQTLRRLGARVTAARRFADHHAYSRGDVGELEQWAAALPPDAIVVTTQKDLVKLRLTRLGDRPLWCLRIRLAIDAGRDKLHELLDTAARPD